VFAVPSPGKLLGALIALRSAGIDKNLLIDINDSGMTFDEIADYLDQNNPLMNARNSSLDRSGLTHYNIMIGTNACVESKDILVQTEDINKCS
jgi:hypothetical protein